ncbi:Holliday junction branch migration protein RuvA [Marinobacterium arenosum]|uniref:Holliday junction branch migration protein RuvA n=1 Tax=Marinobacterium arenosum TaxID=2862496 RepID=UPI001C9500DF|nr:Holliday junction branch migration protein RuvA [Marinobacterium arenosum]MBY4675298.1 Holliday junction branch migration protein RuvA [Marinobacterium arenosum]
MIGRLRGELADKRPPQLLLDVNGVGYEVEASMNTFYKLPAVGTQVTLHTHFVVREDAQLLYGFVDVEERSLFRALIKVNGVGPKMALAILSGIDTPSFIRCVHDGDSGALVKVPGVGKKTAERLIVEMKDKVKDMVLAGPADFSLAGEMPMALEQAANDQAVAEAESALVALGYKPVQASKAISGAEKALGDSASSEALIRHALKSMVG